MRVIHGKTRKAINVHMCALIPVAISMNYISQVGFSNYIQAVTWSKDYIHITKFSTSIRNLSLAFIYMYICDIHLHIYMKLTPLWKYLNLFLIKYWKTILFNTAEFFSGLDWKAVWKLFNFCSIWGNSGQVPAQDFIAV